MRRLLVILSITGFIGLSFLRPAHALILLPTADGTIFDFDGDGNVNYINPDESVQALNNIFSGPSHFESRGLIEFNIHSLLSGGNINHAQLGLTTIDTLGSYPFSLGFYGYRGNGALDNDDYGAGTLLTSLDFNGGPTLDVDVTNFLQNAKASNYDYAGFNIRKLGISSDYPPVYVAFGSLEESPASRLSVDQSPSNPTVPEPASLFLLGSGMFGALVFKRRK